MTNILILAAGSVPSDSSEARFPVFLSESNGTSVLEKIMQSLKGIENAKYTFVFHATDVSKYHLDNSARLLASNARITIVPEITMGSGCTALLAACELDRDQELIIISANEIIDLNLSDIFDKFVARKCDAGTLVFKSILPRYSYVLLNEDGYVVEAAQNKPISHFATTGLFWFAKTGDFVRAAMGMIAKDATTDGKFYLAPTFNEMILIDKKIGVIEIDKKFYIPLKTSRQIESFEGLKS